MIPKEPVRISIPASFVLQITSVMQAAMSVGHRVRWFPAALVLWQHRPDNKNKPARREEFAVNHTRRQFFRLAAGGAGLAAMPRPTWAQAQGYPSRPVRWVLGYTTGGTTDIISRHRDAAADGTARTVLHHRAAPRGRHQSGDRVRGAGRAGRLHAAVRRRAERDQCNALSEAELRVHARHRAGGRHRQRPHGADRASVGAG